MPDMGIISQETKHVILETKHSEFFIISSLRGRSDTQLFTINVECGSLHVENLETQDQALNCLQQRNYQLKNRTEACAILGYVVFGCVGYLLVATKVRGNPFLGGHVMYTIEEKLWIKIPFTNLFSPTKAEQRNIDSLCEFPFVEAFHYYCETLDVTRPFPSTQKVKDYDREFCWNHWLSSAFADIGCREWCAVLLQGIALTSDVQNAKMCLLSRRSQIFPGTRFYARGLNHLGGVGNEMECELIMWTKDNEDEIHWCSFVWRRGTVPIWWKSALKSQVVTESQVIIGEKPYDHSELYYRSLFERFDHNPVVIFNLLRCGPKGEEMLLSEHFQESLKYVKKCINVDIKMVNFDWHHNLKQLGADKCIEGLWSLVRPALQGVDMNEGRISFLEVNTIPTHQAILYPNGRFAFHKTIKKQAGVIRFNCADSLDRTNIATFFVSWQLVVEMCRRMRALYQPERGTEPWKACANTLDKVVQLLRPTTCIESLVESFVVNGDACSILYTNSAAMHSSLMRDYSPNVGNAPLNAIIAIQRRYQNIYLDPARQSQYEMMLGLNLEKYFPWLTKCGAINFSKIECVSRHPSWCIKPIPSLLSHVQRGDMLLHDADNFCWICPVGYDIVELYIYLPKPCHVTDLAITVMHGNNDMTSPRCLDLFMGAYLDKMNVMFQGLAIPRCASGTQLWYNIPSNMWKAYENSGPYDFDVEAETNNYNPMTRIVHIVFRGIPNNANMTLGKVELYGMTHPQKESVPFKEQRTIQHMENILSALEEGTPANPVPHSSTPAQDHHYEDLLKQKIEASNPITFLDALELEECRLACNVSAQQRDSTLLNMKCEIESFNPNRYIYPRDEKAETSLRKSSKYRNKNCGQCQVSLSILRNKQCHYCYKKFCNNCISPVPQKIIPFMWDKPHIVCKGCSEILTKQEAILRRLKQMGDKKRLEHYASTENRNYEFLLGGQGNSSPWNETQNLAEYPLAGILVSVPTENGSLPIESILFPPTLLSLDTYWYAPLGCSSLQVTIALPEATLLQLVLLVDTLGYTRNDVPTITIMAGNSLNNFKTVGMWDLASELQLADDGVIEPLSTLKYTFEDPQTCRLLSLHLALPRSSQEHFLHLGRILVSGVKKPSTWLVHSYPLTSAAPTERLLYENTLAKPPTKNRVPLRALWAQYRSDKKILDMCIEPAMLGGFTINVRHGEEGAFSQVKLIHVVAITTDNKGDVLSLRQICRMIIPLVKPNTQLHFELYPPTYANLLTFEFLCNYGAAEQVPPKISLFASE